MARYKHVEMSPRLLPVDLESQLVPGSFAHAGHHLVDRPDLSAFDAHYCNDANGATAHQPERTAQAMLVGTAVTTPSPATRSPASRPTRASHA